MADCAGEAAPSPPSSPQWMKDFQMPFDDAIELSSSHSASEEEDAADVSISPDRKLKRKRFQLSDSEADDDEPDPESKTTCEDPDAAVEEQVPEEPAGKLCERDEESSRKGEKKTKTKMASSLPLVFPEKILRSKILLECESDALDVSGDIGAVGRVSVSRKDDPEVLLDLKGTIYKTKIVPSNSFFLVNIGTSEAKVEAIMNDFVQLLPDANNINMETMIEGTLEDMQFNSDDEGVAVTAPSEGTEQEKKDAKKLKTKKEHKPPKKPKPSKGNVKVVAKKVSKKNSAKATVSKRGTKKSK